MVLGGWLENKASLLKIYQRDKKNLTLAWEEADSQFPSRKPIKSFYKKKKKKLQPKGKGISLLPSTTLPSKHQEAHSPRGSNFQTAPSLYLVSKAVVPAQKWCSQPHGPANQDMCKEWEGISCAVAMWWGGVGPTQARRMKSAFKDPLKPNFKNSGRAVGCWQTGKSCL